MKLIIYNADKNFAEYIIKEIIKYLSKIKYEIIKRFEEYFIGITWEDILNNLKFKIIKIEDKFIIYIDDNQIYKNYKIIDLCKLINYGNLDISGSYIFTDAFKYIKNNLIKIQIEFLEK